MSEVQPLKQIDGVFVVSLQSHGDERGRFIETFRKEWIPGAQEMVQGNRSDSKQGVLRGLHYHLFQSDYWYVVAGRAVAALYDFRESSSTSGNWDLVEMGDGADVGLYIPPGVAHGFYAVTDVTLTYLVDQYFDGSDEFGIKYDDPQVGIVWPEGDRILSERDLANPPLDGVDAENRPA
ncbi:MAG: dTDP-4-dehydrorhamnose 3,5-epimerase family protein [Actinomycetota bacterium]|nr:dTDP-4-dehydrorhamnose 3,5-epimerase family protein [Actinomycetota bacterium]